MAAYTRKEKLMRGLMIYQRAKSPYWYARIQRPSSVGDIKVGGYRNVSLKTADIDEAKAAAYAEYNRMQSSPSLAREDFGWDALFQRYTDENKANGINRVSITNHWNTYLRTYIREHDIKAVEDFTATKFREFIEYRRSFWIGREKTARNVALDPADSTMKEALVMTGTILTALYSYVDKPKPDFSIIIRRFSSRVSRREHRSKKTRGFALSQSHFNEIRRRMATWAHDDSVYNIHHRYARQRLYYAMILAYRTRARPGTELRNIKLRNIAFREYENIKTFHIETRGKIGARSLLMDIGMPGGTADKNMFQLWLNALHRNFPGMGFDSKSAYLFAGSTRGKIDGMKQLPGTRFSQLFKAFLRMPGNEDIRFHPGDVTGRSDDNALEVCFYDIRSTAISHYIDYRKNVNHIEMAYLCGVTVATMEYYYLYHNEKRNADRWLGFLNTENDDPKKLAEDSAMRDAAVKLINEAEEHQHRKQLEP